MAAFPFGRLAPAGELRTAERVVRRPDERGEHGGELVHEDAVDRVQVEAAAAAGDGLVGCQRRIGTPAVLREDDAGPADRPTVAPGTNPTGTRGAKRTCSACRS